jgi:hypothetical protein
VKTACPISARPSRPWLEAELGPLGAPLRYLSPLAALDYNKPGSPESRAEDKLRVASANTSVPGYQYRRPGASALTGGLDPVPGRDL